MRKPEGYDEIVSCNKAAMKKYWENFKKSDDYGRKPYLPLLISPGLVSIDFDNESDGGILNDGWRN